jgi:hypothetical protein
MAKPKEAASASCGHTDLPRGGDGQRGTRSSGGYFRLPDWLTTDERMLDLSHRQFRLFVHLLSDSWRGGGSTRTNMKVGQVYRSVPEIAEDLRIDRSSVYSDIRHMVEVGLLRRGAGKIVIEGLGKWLPPKRPAVGETPTPEWEIRPPGVGATPTPSGSYAHAGRPRQGPGALGPHGFRAFGGRSLRRRVVRGSTNGEIRRRRQPCLRHGRRPVVDPSVVPT